MVMQQIDAIATSYRTMIAELAGRKGLHLTNIDINIDSMGTLVEAVFFEVHPYIGPLNVELKGTPEQVHGFLGRLQDA